MSIPNLKRVRISSVQELESWLAKQSDQAQSVMVVTYSEATHDKFVSHDQVGDVLTAHGWDAGRRYTLNGNLIGHVMSKQQA
jgi:hypothetical protein